MADGRWQMADGRWQMADTKYRAVLTLASSETRGYPQNNAPGIGGDDRARRGGLNKALLD
jgi:hypothetical protein